MLMIMLHLHDQVNPAQVLLQTPFNVLSLNQSNTPAPLAFEPACLLTLPPTTNLWLVDNMPSTLAVRAFGTWLKDLPINDAQRAVLPTNITKTEAWWGRQPAEALDTVPTSGSHDGHPCQPHEQKL